MLTEIITLTIHLFLMLAPLFIIIFFLVYFIIVLPDKTERKKREKEIQEWKEQGIEPRSIIDSYGFYVFKIVANEKYYLHKDGKFYTSYHYKSKFVFKTKEEMDMFIEENMKNFKNKFGEDVQIQKYRKELQLDYCKVLD